MSERKLTNEMKAVLAKFIGKRSETKVRTCFGERKILGQADDLPFDTDFNLTMEVYRKVDALDYKPNSIVRAKYIDLAMAVYKRSNFAYPTPEPLAIALYDFIVFHNQHSNV